MRIGIAALVLAYVLSQFYRAFLAVMAPVLTEDLGVTAAELASASGWWFLAFAAMQVPIGAWLDRVGPRLTSGLLLALGAVGAVIFSQATGALQIKLAMALIGVETLPVARLNLADLVFAPGAVRSSIVNWAEVAAYLMHRLREGVRRHGQSAPVARVLMRVRRHEGMDGLSLRPEGTLGQVLLPLEFEMGGQVTRWFTTVTSFGAPQDALAEEITIEQFHPA